MIDVPIAITYFAALLIGYAVLLVAAAIALWILLGFIGEIASNAKNWYRRRR